MASAARPIASMRRAASRMQVSTSTRRRRAAWCIIGSAEATSGRPRSAASRASRAKRRGVLAVVARARRRDAGRGRRAGEGAGAGQPCARGRPGRQVQEQAQVGAEVVEVGRRGAGSRPWSARRGAEGEQAAEPGPAGAVARQRGQLGPLRQAEPGGGQEARRGAPPSRAISRGLEMGAHEAGDRVAVGDGEGGQAELGRAAARIPAGGCRRSGR